MSLYKVNGILIDINNSLIKESVTMYGSLLSGLTAYYRMNETGGTTAYDSKGTNNITTLNCSIVAGKNRNGISANGNDNSYATFGTKLSTFWDNPYTISLWVKFNVITPTYGNILVWAGDRNQQHIVYPTGIIVLQTFDGTPKAVASNNTVTTGQWYHIVLQRVSSSAGKIYLSGNECTYSVNAVCTVANTLALDFRLFSRSDALTANGDQIMDEIGFWNRAITAAEVTQLYNAGNGIFY